MALEVIDPLRDTASEDERDTAMHLSVHQRDNIREEPLTRVATSYCPRVG
jgi:hypothetical protein